MDRRLVDYLPELLRQYREFQAICRMEQPEFALAWGTAEGLLNEQFLETAENVGLARWEKMLGIIPKATDSLEKRRFALQSRLSEVLPYTLPQLRRLLQNLCGEEIGVWVNDYQLTVRLPERQRKNLPSIRGTVGRMAPMNLAVELGLLGEPFRVANENSLLLRNFMLSFRFSNGARRPILLDGRRTLSGGWLLNQAFRGVELRRFGVGLRVQEKETLTGTLTAEAKRPLNGSRKLDGSWKLNGGRQSLILR